MRKFEFDFTFLFEPIQNRGTQVTLVSHHLKGKQDIFNVSINDDALSINGFSVVPSISADLLDIAVAIHAVDRLIKRNTVAPLAFRVVLPVRNSNIFTRNDVFDLLTNALEWYTNDCWRFEFIKREASSREVEIQPQLPLNKQFRNVEVALWSGGLDSLSGLYNRLMESSNIHHVLIGTGSNFYVKKQQERIAHKIGQLFPDRTSLVQIPYRWGDTHSPKKNFSQRSRGLVFMLIGAASAYHVNCNSLFIYENGIGAINLPFSKGQAWVDQAKSVHPLSLLRVGKLLSSILDRPFQICNPYWLWTKAQMIESLINSNVENLISLSFSCDRIHRTEQGIIQCGVCTSCLLRRQSLNALGINDSSSYVSSHIDKSGEHFSAMQFQVSRIRTLLQTCDPWVSMSKEYNDLDDIVDQISMQSKQERLYLRRQIIQLYSRYVDEWNLFEKHIEETLQVM